MQSARPPGSHRTASNRQRGKSLQGNTYHAHGSTIPPCSGASHGERDDTWGLRHGKYQCIHQGHHSPRLTWDRHSRTEIARSVRACATL